MWVGATAFLLLVSFHPPRQNAGARGGSGGCAEGGEKRQCWDWVLSSSAFCACNFKTAFTRGCINTKLIAAIAFSSLAVLLQCRFFPRCEFALFGCGSYCLAGVSRSHWPAFMRRLPASARCPCCSSVCPPWPWCSEMERLQCTLAVITVFTIIWCVQDNGGTSRFLKMQKQVITAEFGVIHVALLLRIFSTISVVWESVK